MKKQDIAALIDGKIKGQGSAIDIGGALPEILGGLNENSVSEDMEESEQMQMRKDLGLYYDLTKTEEKVAEYTDQDFVNYFAKISDETPAKDELIGVENLAGELLPLTDFDVADMSPDATVGYMILTGGINTQFIIYFKEADGRTPGIYIGTTAATTYKGLKWQEVIPDKQGIPDEYIIPDTEEGKMQMRKGLGLYYEETGIVEKTTEVYSGNPAVDHRKVSSDAPAMEDIVGVILNFDGAAHDIPVSELTLEWGTENEAYWIRQVSESEGWEISYFKVVLMDGYGGLPAGIFASADTEVYHQQLVYKASETVISKVPEKFLPEMGDEVEGNPEVPQGTSPTPLENMRINDNYFSVPQGGGGDVMRVSYMPDYADDFESLVRYGWTEELAQKVLAGTVKSIVVGSQGNEVLSVLYARKLLNEYSILYATADGTTVVHIDYVNSTFSQKDTAMTWWNG